MPTFLRIMIYVTPLLVQRCYPEFIWTNVFECTFECMYIIVDGRALRDLNKDMSIGSKQCNGFARYTWGIQMSMTINLLLSRRGDNNMTTNFKQPVLYQTTWWALNWQMWWNMNCCWCYYKTKTRNSHDKWRQNGFKFLWSVSAGWCMRRIIRTAGGISKTLTSS